jgi:hypothetical protein
VKRLAVGRSHWKASWKPFAPTQETVGNNDDVLFPYLLITLSLIIIARPFYGLTSSHYKTKESCYWQVKIYCIIITRVSSINHRTTFLLPLRQLPFFGQYVQVSYVVIFLRNDMDSYKSSAMFMVKGKKDDSISKNLSNEALLDS